MRLPLRVVVDVVQQGCYFPEHSKSAVLQGLVVALAASVAVALAFALEEAAVAGASALVVVEFVRFRLRSRKGGCPLLAALRIRRLRRRLRQISPYRRH